MAPLGIPWLAWAFFTLGGGLLGLILGTSAEPRWSALPRWFPRGKVGVEELHFAFGALAALGGLLAMGLFGSLVPPLVVALTWAFLVVGSALVGVPREERRGIALVYVKVVGGLAALLLGAYVLFEVIIAGNVPFR